jgi:hypothetical protein
MRTALVTGATSGIGAEFARQLAEQRYALVIVARDKGRLEAFATELRAAHDVTVEVLAADLVSPDGLAAVESRAANPTNPIDLLVNNAGFGMRAPFEENPISDEIRLLDLLVVAPLRLTHAALAQMLPRHSGMIINIASVAGFTPRGTYGAAKAWVLSFSRSANLAYRKRGVTVTAVAPGFVRTEFHQRMGVRTNTIPPVMWLSARQVVRIALRDAVRGTAVSIPTVRYKILVAVARMLPAKISAVGGLSKG